MQIDFHHAAMYVLSRLAGFSKDEAEIISYSSQYVDDATNDGTIEFTNGARYSRISSAHKLIDTRNIDPVKNHKVWVPFHFLPGNGGVGLGLNPAGGFINKLVCKPFSYVARDMLEKCLADKEKPYGLHRLGITLHVLADTFSHQGFAGVVHEVNIVSDINIQDDPEYMKGLKKKIPKIYRNYNTTNWILITIRKLSSKFIKSVLPLGHGAVLSLPDIPYLRWSYSDEDNAVTTRDNSKFFIDAVEHIYDFLFKYKNNIQLDASPEKMPSNYLDEIRKNIFEFNDEGGDDRHISWLKAILGGQFGFKEEVDYIEKGEGSWKYKALNIKGEIDNGIYEYSDNFLKSDWKMFHDALQKHEFEITHEILPKYGICVA